MGAGLSLTKCPVCGLLNTELAGQCDCGFDFQSHMVNAGGRVMSVTEVGSRTVSRGVAVVVGGLIALGLQFGVMARGNPDKFLTVYVAGAVMTLVLGVHQIVRGIGLRSLGKKLRPNVR